MNQHFVIRKRGKVVYIQMNFAHPLNLLDREAMAALLQVFETLKTEPDLGAVVLAGKVRAFVGGASIHAMRDLNPETARTFIRDLHQCLTAIRHLPVPVIAAIRGYALGAGCELACACDLRLASETAIFGMPEIKVGIPSVIEGALLVPLIGLSRTAHMVLTGETINAQEAERIGLVSKILPDAQIEDEAIRIAEEIADFSPNAVRLQKNLLLQWQNKGMEQAMQDSIEAFSQAYTTGDPHEAMSAFLEKRPPILRVKP
jgi:enoyl-CoA hydratase